MTLSPIVVIILIFLALIVAGGIFLTIAARNARRGGRTGESVKERALSRLRSERAKLEGLLATLPPEQIEQPGAVGEWSVKDVLAHLYHWERLLLGWIADVRRGKNPPVPAPGIGWNDIDKLNEEIFQEHEFEPLETVQERFRSTHLELESLIESMSEEELSTPGAYPWTERTSLGGWIGAFATHDGWATNAIKKWLNEKKKKEKKQAV
jgi:hypothetical protein